MTMSKSVKELFLKDLADLETTATHEHRAPNDHELRRLQSLAQIADAAERLAPKPVGARWRVAGVFVASMIIASAFLFAHVRSTEIEVTVSSESVAFRLARDQTILPTVPLSSISATGSLRANLPTGRGPDGEDFSGTGLELRQLKLKTNDGVGAAITFSGLAAPAETEIRMQSTGRTGGATFLFLGKPISFDVVLTGPLTLATDGDELPRVLDFRLGQKAEIDASPDAFSLRLVPWEEGLSVTAPIEISALNLRWIPATLADGPSPGDSRILGGTVNYASGARAPYALGPGSSLQMTIVDEGEIRALSLAEHAAELVFRGRVSALTTDRFGRDVNLMPTYLEWLHAEHGLALLWGAAIYLFGAFSAIKNWWRGEG